MFKNCRQNIRGTIRKICSLFWIWGRTFFEGLVASQIHSYVLFIKILGMLQSVAKRPPIIVPEDYPTSWKSIYIVTIVAIMGTLTTYCVMPMVYPYMKKVTHISVFYFTGMKITDQNYRKLIVNLIF